MVCSVLASLVCRNWPLRVDRNSTSPEGRYLPSKSSYLPCVNCRILAGGQIHFEQVVEHFFRHVLLVAFVGHIRDLGIVLAEREDHSRRIVGQVGLEKIPGRPGSGQSCGPVRQPS